MRVFCYIIFVLALLALSLPSKVCADLNLIDNPSAELSNCGEPISWTHTKNTNNSTVFNYHDSGSNGLRSLGITVTNFISGAEYWSFNEITVPFKFSHYRYSAHYKSDITSKLILITKNNAGVESSLEIANLPSANIWTRISVDVPIPNGAVTMRIVHAISQPGTIQLDDFLLEDKSAVIPSNTKNLIPNPSLEFENDDSTSAPKKWSQVAIGNNSAEFIYLNSGHTGNKSIKMAITAYESGRSYNYFEPVSIQGGDMYDYSFFHKSNVYTEVNAEITLAGGEVQYQFLGMTFPSTSWTQFSTRIKMPDDAVKVSLYNLLYSVGTITQDDFNLELVEAVPFKRPIVSVTFDDSFKSFHDIVYPLFKSKGFLGTAYVLSGDFGSPDQMSSKDFKEMYRDGFELGSHTVSHPHLPFVSTTLSYNELLRSKSDITNFTGVVPKNFASPYGEYNDVIKIQAKNFYRSHRSTDVGYNTKESFDIYNIKTQNPIYNTSPETVLSWVDTAIADNAWLVLVYHEISDSSDKFTNTPEHLERVLDGLVTRGVFVTTVDEALNEIVPQMPD